MLVEYGLTFVVIYAISLVIFAVTGTVLERINARNPNMRIQPGRDGLRRKAEDIRNSLPALALSCLFLATGYFARKHGWTVTPWELTWVTAIAGFAIGVVTFDAWFYFGHRILHMKAFYRWHALHHKAVAPSPWSNDSSTLIDTAFEHSYYLIVWFVLPLPAEVIIAVRLLDQVTGMIGHSGFEYFASASSRWPSPMITTTFHDLHHSQFRYNYGNFFSFWDRVLGTMHPDYDRMIRRMEAGETPGEATARRAEPAAGPEPAVPVGQAG